MIENCYAKQCEREVKNHGAGNHAGYRADEYVDEIGDASFPGVTLFTRFNGHQIQFRNACGFDRVSALLAAR